MSAVLLSCVGGTLSLPDPRLVLVDRADGGNLIVSPPREVWDRSELNADELTQWSFLVAAAGRAMLDTLPQLDGGCINYWDAGNWALNYEAEPRGLKHGREHRRVHLHLLGRSRSATSLAHHWGEAVMWPEYAHRHAWAARYRRLTADECRAIVAAVGSALTTRYGVPAGTIEPWAPCASCDYPTVVTAGETPVRCGECRSTA